MSYLCRKWGDTDVLWKNSNWQWSVCQLVQDIVESFPSGIDASRIYEDDLWKNDDKKRERLIRLICKIKDEVYDETKKVKDLKIKVDDIRLVVKTVLDIELKVK